MAQRQWRSDDTSAWLESFGSGSYGDQTVATSCDYKVTDAPVGNTANCYGLITGTAGDYTASVVEHWGFSTTYMADGDVVLIHQSRGTGAGQWELNKIVSGLSSGTQTITFKYPLIYNYVSGAQIVRAPMVNNFTVNSGVTLSAAPYTSSLWGGIMFIYAKGTATITGTLNTSSKGFPGGVVVSGDTVGKQGAGTGGAGTNSQSANGDGGGGGQRHLNGVYNPSAGGGGGHAAAGSNPTNKTNSGSGTVGGAAAGSASMVTMAMPGAGGSGGGKSGGGNSGVGGLGAGLIVIVAKEIVLSGTMTNSGGNGGAPSNTSDAGCDGGGGGAGGGVLMKTETATLGTSKITVAAGSGNTSGYHSNGGNGSVGRIHLDYSVSYTGTTSPTLDVTNDTTITSVYPTTNYLHLPRRSRTPGSITGI